MKINVKQNTHNLAPLFIKTLDIIAFVFTYKLTTYNLFQLKIFGGTFQDSYLQHRIGKWLSRGSHISTSGLFHLKEWLELKQTFWGYVSLIQNTVVTETDLVKLQVLLRISKESYSILCSLFNGRDPENQN